MAPWWPKFWFSAFLRACKIHSPGCFALPNYLFRKCNFAFSSFLHVFISSCFHFFKFSFFYMSLLLIAFVMLSRVLRIWENVFYSQAFFTLHSFMFLSRLSFRSALQVTELPTEVWNTDPAYLFVWITQCLPAIW